MTQADVEG
jgi:hypothetical protein